MVVRKRMKKTPAVQNGRTLPMGRCAGPPPPLGPVLVLSVKILETSVFLDTGENCL